MSDTLYDITFGPTHVLFFAMLVNVISILYDTGALSILQNEIVFKVMKICFFVSQLMFCIKIMFYVYSTQNIFKTISVKMDKNWIRHDFRFLF